MKHPALRHPGRWLWLILLVPIAVGVARLRFDVEVFDLLPENLPAVEGLKLYQQYFSNARELLVTVQAPSAEAAENAAREIAQRLRPKTNLVAAVTWEAPWMEHPDQLAEFIAYLWFNQPPNVFGQLTNRLGPKQIANTLAETKEQLSTSMTPEDIARLNYDPLGLTHLPASVAGAAPSFGQGQSLFSSPDGRFRIVFVRANQELRGYKECDDWLNAIKGIVDNAGSPGNGVEIGYTGRPAIVAETAGGMKHDVITSVGGTAGIIAVLFWLAHRRVKPMLWLLTLLALILGSTLALGGLIFGTINVVSMGFAAILLGLAVDYAVVHYQEALAHPDMTIPQIRHAIAPSIFWAAVTTISAFLVLNFGGLPGLGQLGTLVGLGVGLSALIMIFEYLPPLFPNRNKPDFVPVDAEMPPAFSRPLSPHVKPMVFGLTVALLLVSLIVFILYGYPSVDPTANALRPRKSPAYTAMDEIQANLNQHRETLWLIVGGNTETAVARRLDEVQSSLAAAKSNGLVTSFTLPTALWPNPQYQEANRPIAFHLAEESRTILEAGLAAGFLRASFALTAQMLQTWRAAAKTRGTFWPANSLSQWIFDKVVARAPTNYFALGLITPAPGANAAQLDVLQSKLPRKDVWLSGWELLGSAIFERVRSNMWKVVAPMVFLVFLSLWLAFRRPAEILLSLAVLVLSGLFLLAVMRMAGWSWNLLNLMAIPLVLGTGVDYTIFMQLALRRYNGNRRRAYHSVGRALLLCGGTAIGAFGTLAFSSNAGMGSLGEVCAVGIAGNVLIAVFLLPTWWHVVKKSCGISENENLNIQGGGR